MASDSSFPPSPGGKCPGFGGSSPNMIRRRVLISCIVDSCLRISSMPVENAVARPRWSATSDRRFCSSQSSPLRMTYSTRNVPSRTTAIRLAINRIETVRRLMRNRRGAEVAPGKTTMWYSERFIAVG